MGGRGGGGGEESGMIEFPGKYIVSFYVKRSHLNEFSYV